MNRVEEFFPVEARLEPAREPAEPQYSPIAISCLQEPEEVEAGTPLFLHMVEGARFSTTPELSRRLSRSLAVRASGAEPRSLPLFPDLALVPASLWP